MNNIFIIVISRYTPGIDEKSADKIQYRGTRQ